LSYCAHAVRWGERVTPLKTSDVDLPRNDQTALELIRDVTTRKTRPVTVAEF